MYPLEKVITIEGSLPPETPSLARIEEGKDSTLRLCLSSPTTLEIEASNIKVLRLDIVKMLEGLGLSPAQISSYVAQIQNSASKYAVKVSFDAEDYFIVLDLPKSWKVTTVTVNGKTPEALIVDNEEGVVFIPVIGASPSEIDIYMESTFQSAISSLTLVTAGIIVLSAVSALLKTTIVKMRG